MPAAALAARLAAAGEPSPSAALELLVEGGALVARGSALDREERVWGRTWRWGPVAAAFHRSLRDVSFEPVERTVPALARLARTDPPPAVLPREGRRRRALPEPRRGRGVLLHLLRRRSEREFSPRPLALADLADVLFAGFGVRALLRDPVQGTLPLKLAPSGGARNPIDGHLYALRVRGLEPGFYRYSGLRRDLEPAPPGPLPPPRLLLGGQPWADQAAAVIFLVAHLDRSSWKYRHPLSYRMITLEAGHIAQNLLVAACDLGMAAWPSGAISDSAAEAALSLQGPDTTVLYAVVLGSPAQRRSRASSARSSASSG
jgi:SagB-type dehydrogenase family enzyme